MTTPEDGLEDVDLRSKWPNEAWDFTPWLAENLHLLGAELGLNLKHVQTERQVGTMRLDILATETTSGAPVAIENQLEWTDINHLGQLLIYAAGVDAKIGIWVAAGFTKENAQALHKLNEWSGDEIRFYGVKVKLIKGSANEEPTPRFSKVVYPGGWDKDNTLPASPPPSPFAQACNEFYRPIEQELFRARFSDTIDKLYGDGQRYFRSPRIPGLWYELSLSGKNDAWADIYIRTDDKELTKRVFDELEKDRAAIESGIDAGPYPEWHWSRESSYTYSFVGLRMDGNLYDPPEKLDEIRAWMLDLLPQFKEEFEPRLERILSELSTNGE